jgi:hypothetical protein
MGHSLASAAPSPGIAGALAFLDDACRLAVDMMATTTVFPEASAGRHLLLALIRTLSHGKSVRVLLAEGRVLEAGIIGRCCVENLLIAEAVARDPDRVIADLRADHRQSRVGLGEAVIQHVVHDIPEEAERVGGAIRRLRREGALFRLSPTKLAKGGQAAGLAAVYAFLSNNAAHFSYDSLERFLPRGDGQAGFDLIVEPDYTEEETTAAALYPILSLLLIMRLLCDSGWNAGLADRVADENERLVRWIAEFGRSG